MKILKLKWFLKFYSDLSIITYFRYVEYIVYNFKLHGTILDSLGRERIITTCIQYNTGFISFSNIFIITNKCYNI